MRAPSFVRADARSTSLSTGHHAATPPRRHNAAAPSHGIESPSSRAKQDSDFSQAVRVAREISKEDSRDRKRCITSVCTMYARRVHPRTSSIGPEARTYTVIDELILAFFARETAEASRIEDRRSNACTRRTGAFRIPRLGFPHARLAPECACSPIGPSVLSTEH